MSLRFPKFLKLFNTFLSQNQSITVAYAFQVEAEDNMNCQMQNLTVTYRDGRTSQLENVFIRGSKIRFLILPDMLKNAPMFKKQGTKAGVAGRGKSAILRAQAARRGGGKGGPPGRPGQQQPGKGMPGRSRGGL